MDISKIIATIIIGFSLMQTCSALECYVCSNQTNNREKCLNTIKTCAPGEDVCLSEIRWGSTPYFSLGAQKQFYVSKRCSTKKLCQKIRTKYMPYCTHIWYEDWTCSECCLGDRCNYFIISGSSKYSLSLAIGVFSAFVAVRKLFFV
uniref:Putative secreted protein n=1 Tax=Corethrella appendiculata TaxID=1370023 RepID=U5EEL0_9DIPT